ncbi:39S ribosomal protein l46, mitochondrial [Plakobranchus ocellatus]|uniref:Large ribosomal subunit protein mL46 n=1 Tax=Plakobranchus ocellatus TaxID=259542 RepID=A0AAV3YN45_9GAST|nr:39S ribosomal protein l46, mitochondrial [Plakobranchus ocellatus]
MAYPPIFSSLMRCIQLCSRAKLLRAQSISSLLSSNQIRHGSILYSAVCVERYPVITSNKSTIEERFSELLSKLEQENSFLSDHEVRHLKEEQAAKMKQENADEESGNVDTETVTALDLEDKWDAEIKSFTPASRVTQADEQQNQKSVERRLESSLYLLVKQNIAGREHWVLPQATWENGETLRQTAERALSSVCGDVKATVLGNAPCAVAKYEPPKEDEEKPIKLFFYKAWYREGNVNTDSGLASDYVWVTKEEFKDFCHNSYNGHLKKFIFDM